MDQESFDTYKNAQLDIIWAKLEEIYTNIEYSSLKAASEKSNVQKRIIVALIVINAIYSSVCFLYSEGILKPHSLAYIVISAIYIFGGGIIAYFKSDWLEEIVGLKTQNGQKLIELNSSLETYRLKIFGNFAKARVCEDEKEFESLIKDFHQIVSDYLPFEKKHDELTGVIDPVLEKEAQRRAKLKMLELTKSIQK